MRQFLKFIVFRIALIISLLYLLDFVFSAIYRNTNTIRNKNQYILKNKNLNFDYIFLGSSRVEFHVNTKLIDSITQKKSLNLGVSGQDLIDTFLTLKMLKENNIKAKKYFIQLDENITQSNKNSFIGSSYIMPYTNNSTIKNHLKKYDKKYIYDCYIPFYRYINYGYKIGFRELMLTLIGKSRKVDFFIPLNKTITDKEKKIIFDNIIKENKLLLRDIKEFAKKNNLNLYFFTAPYYNAKNSSSLKQVLLKNNTKIYVDSIKSHFNYKDNTHLNSKGANKFTKMLIRDFSLDTN